MMAQVVHTILTVSKQGFLAALLLAATAPLALGQAGQTASSPFDLTQQEGEHPLAPVTRVMQQVQQNMQQNVRDYSCTLVKHERLDGELGERQHIYMKVLSQPFSVYMQFLQPFSGREVLYVAGTNDGNLIALDGGWKRKIMAPVSLDPEGMIAMRDQKYPITRVGLENLVNNYLQYLQNDMKFSESIVSTNPNTQIDGRSATLIQVTHPTPRREFRSHISRIFLDNELQVPLHYDSYMWPTAAGASPPLEESYTYSNLKLNNGFTARDFDKENPEIFKQ